MNRKERRAAKSSGGSLHGSSQAEDLYKQAVAHHQGGRLDEAYQLYRNILEIEPDNADTLHMMGMLATQIGKPETAVEFISQAIKLRDEVPYYYNDFGNAWHNLGKLEAAAKSYEEAIRLKKDYPEAYYNLGNVLNRQGRFDEAAAQYNRAIALCPGFSPPYNNLGSLLREQKKLTEAAACLERAVAVSPESADARNNLGLVLMDQGKLKEAEEQFRKALALNPGFVSACNNLGLALKEQGKLQEARAQFERAIQLNPGVASIYNNLGNVLQALGRFDEVLAVHQKSLEINPHSVIGWINLGNALSSLGRHAEALPWFDKVIAQEPQNTTAHHNRGAALEAMGNIEEALASYCRAHAIAPDTEGLDDVRLAMRMQLCDWSEYGLAGQQLEKIRKGQYACAPFSLLSLPSAAEDQLKCAEIFVSRKNPPAPVPLYKGPRPSHGKIRLAYLSADFHDHATAYLMAGLFELHDKSRFETTAISFLPGNNSRMRERLIAAFDHFIDAQMMSDDQVARLMLEREIDIAVDLKGFTQNCRANIFAKRAAPVQVNYIGFPGTMGASYIDYIIADKVVIPPEMQRFFTEKVAYLPGSYQVNDRKRVISPRRPSRTELGLPENTFVFCSFNGNYKITPEMFDVWMRILKAVDNSVLWLYEGNKTVVANLRREAQQRGIAPERLVFAPKMKVEDHLARHACADLVLDSLPYNAHTTAADALWAGLPVLTCQGETFAGRVAASLLTAVGLPELITHSMEEYERLALRLTREPAMLAALKEKLARNRDTYPLFDTERYTRHLEKAYQTMWQRHQEGAAPETFEVN